MLRGTVCQLINPALFWNNLAFPIARFRADNNPIYPLFRRRVEVIQPGKRCKNRFDRNKRFCPSTEEIFLHRVFASRPVPESVIVQRQYARLNQLDISFWILGQEQVAMLRCSFASLNYRADPLRRHPLAKQICHAAHEDIARFRPAHRLIQPVPMKCRFEPKGIRSICRLSVQPRHFQRLVQFNAGQRTTAHR